MVAETLFYMASFVIIVKYGIQEGKDSLVVEVIGDSP